MDLKTFIDQTEPEVLQKLAEDAQNEFIDKLLPFLEKTAEYTVQILLQKLAEQQEVPVKEEEIKEEVIDKEEAPKEEELEEGEVINTDPATASKSNETMDPSTNIGGLKAQDVKDALDEAIDVGQAEKILPFCKTLASQYPEAFNEVVKMVKVSLHDAVMKKKLEPDDAVGITDQLNAMIGGE